MNIFKRAYKGVRQAGRYVDKNVLQNKYVAGAAGIFNPLAALPLLGYQYGTGKGLFGMPGLPKVGDIPTAPDFTDVALREAERKRRLQGSIVSGSRQSAFLNNRTGIADLQDNIMGY